MEKNLEWLNSKWWYRLLKVVYVFIFLSVSALFVGLAFDELTPYQTLDLEQSTFVCLSGNTKTFSYRNLLPIEDLSSLKNKRIKYSTIAVFCGIKGAFGEDVSSGSTSFKQYQERDDYEEVMSAWHKKLEGSFILNSTEKTVGSWWQVVFASLGSIVGILLVLEIIKRTFYYIVLGKIRPRI